MIFTNPAGAPELGCEDCASRWFDRMTNTCYECGLEVPDGEVRAFEEALARYRESLEKNHP
ncbi:MAG: cysteine protease [Rhodospirillales bacterium]|nr:cysteine protease [Rhodospirillales bacterium]